MSLLILPDKINLVLFRFVFFIICLLSQAKSYSECLLQDVPINQENFKIVYTGQGLVEFKNHKLRLKPQISLKPAETHASLVLLNKPLVSTNYKLQVLYENVAPLRKNKPNPWEVLWVFFNYQGSVEHKKTNYFIAKTNGLELGRAYKQINQEFLLTKNSPKVSYKTPIQLDLYVDKQQIIVQLNAQNVIMGDYNIYRHQGQIGVYTEDAEILISKIKYCSW